MSSQVGIEFYVPGRVVGKQRPRVTRRGTFTPQDTLDAESQIGWTFRAALRGTPWPTDRRYGIDVTFTGTHHQTDIDNAIKTVLDGLNKLAWDDDRQVTDVIARKREGEPGTRIALWYYAGDEEDAKVLPRMTRTR